MATGRGNGNGADNPRAQTTEDGPSRAEDPTVAGLSYATAAAALDEIIEEFETGVVDVDRLVDQLERATAIVDELDRRLRRTRMRVEELVPRLEAVGQFEQVDVDDPGDGTEPTWEGPIEEAGESRSASEEGAPGLF